MIYIICIWLISSIACANIFYAFLRRRFEMIANESIREDLAIAIIVGCLYGIMGPIGILLMWIVVKD